jgi:hypothetical protein
MIYLIYDYVRNRPVGEQSSICLNGGIQTIAIVSLCHTHRAAIETNSTVQHQSAAYHTSKISEAQPTAATSSTLIRRDFNLITDPLFKEIR